MHSLKHGAIFFSLIGETTFEEKTEGMVITENTENDFFFLNGMNVLKTNKLHLLPLSLHLQLPLTKYITDKK